MPSEHNQALMNTHVLQLISYKLNIAYKYLRIINEGYQNIIIENVQDSTFIRVSHMKRRDKKQLAAEVEWLHYLLELGVNVNIPVEFESSKFVEEVEVNQEQYFLIQFKKVMGTTIDVSNTDVWTNHFFKQWGEVTGRLHKASQYYNTESKRLTRFKWNEESLTLFYQLQKQDRTVAEKYLKLRNHINELKKDNQVYGMIHNDNHHGNVIISDSGPCLIDTDDCCYSWYVKDMAVALYHVNWHGKTVYPNWTDLDNDFLFCFLEGYNRHKNVSTTMLIHELPLFLREREYFLFYLFSKIWDLNKMECWQKETLNRLRENCINELDPIKSL